MVVVSIDTLRPDQLSVYGGSVPAPAFARLAREGVVFDNVHTVAPLTLPAHASLFTAQWPYTHGVRDNVGFYLPERADTLAQHLKEQGYRTGGFVSAFVLDSRFGIHRGFERYFDEFDALDDDVAGGFVSQRPGRDVLDAAREWIDEVSTAEAPFFAFVHLFEPHTPYEPPDRFQAGGDDRARYRGEVAHADALLGDLLRWLDERELGERTLVAVVSDHGESLGEHGEATHGLFVYESTLRIPWLLRYPGAPAGTRVRGWARIIDVAPTLLDLLRLPALPGAEGVSRTSFIESPDALSDDTSYAESFLPRLHYGWSPLRSLRRGQHKLVLAPTPELYDLERDPDETENLFESNPETARPLVRELSGVVDAESESVAAAPVDSESQERLRALGYLGTGGARSSSTDRDLADPKERLATYHLLNDPVLGSLGPEHGPAFAEALSRLASVVEAEPDIPRARILYGDMLLRARRPREAVEVFRGLVEREGSFDGLLGLGAALQQAGDLAAAYDALESAHEVEPSNTKAHARLSEVAGAQGDAALAESWIREAIEISPNRVLRARLAALLLEAGRADEASSVLDAIARDYQGDAVALYNLGQTLFVGGDAAAALDLFRVAVALDPEDADVRHGIGNALLSLGDAEGSIEAYDAAITLAPCFTAAHGNRGLALAQLRRGPEAAASYERAIECDPGYVAAYRNLAALRLEAGDIGGAIATLERARSQLPGDGELAAQLAELRAYRDRRR